MLPLFLNVTDRLVLVVGAGAVGQRKARALLAAGARVHVVDPVRDVPGAVWVPERYRAEHLDGVRLVFAAAPASVNATVVAEARARGIWVNSATDPEQGDVVLPATVRQGELTIAVTTGGAAPALARRIRERLETLFDKRFADWVALLAELRPEVLVRVPEPQRPELFERLSDWSWLDRLRTEGLDAVRAAMQGMVNEHCRP